jgi:hypothetical protein
VEEDYVEEYTIFVSFSHAHYSRYVIRCFHFLNIKCQYYACILKSKQLFQSKAVPSTYMCGAKFARPHRPTVLYRDELRPKELHHAMQDFEKFFASKTGRRWDLRLEKVNLNSDNFTYTPPVFGRPVGLLPVGYIRPEEREAKK